MNWSAINKSINDHLTAIGTVASIAGVVPILLTWWEVWWGRKRRHWQWFLQVQKDPGERPGLLIVDLLEKGNIVNDVELFRQNSERLRTVPADRIFKVTRQKYLSAGDIPEIAKEIRRVTEDVIEAGVDVLHVFYSGPVAPMALVGAEFANVRRVLLYQRNREGIYENWAPLRH